MENTLNRKEIVQDVNFGWINNKKFKHNRLTANFILPLDKNKVANNAVVMLILRKGSKSYADFAKFNAKLNSLYGATVFTDITRFNKFQKLSIGIHFLDNRYAMEKEDLVQECSQLLLDLIFNPNFGGDSLFNEEDLELEKQYLIDTIEAEINDKRSYALTRIKEEMFKDSPISIPAYGRLETAKVVTAQSVTEAWKELVNNARVEIMFTGAGNPASAMELFADKFSQQQRMPEPYGLLKSMATVEGVNSITENMEGIQQGKLVLGMRIEGLNTEDEVCAARLFAAAYGGTPFSKLFLNVRERLSLCYYCASRLDELNNIVIVDSGVEFENVEKARKEILNQLEEFKHDNLTNEELKNTKLLVVNAITNVNDKLSSVENWYLNQIIKGTAVSPEQDIENINKVTKEQVIEAANKVNLDTEYLLLGKTNYKKSRG